MKEHLVGKHVLADDQSWRAHCDLKLHVKSLFKDNNQYGISLIFQFNNDDQDRNIVSENVSLHKPLGGTVCKTSAKFQSESSSLEDL